MLSLLLTAIVLLAALLGALHLRSAAASVVAAALAAGALFGLSRRPLDGLAQPGLHLAYAIDEARAVLPGPNLPERAAETVRSRLQRTGLEGATVRVVPAAGGSAAPTLDVVARIGPGDEEPLRAALGLVGLVEFVEVDDETKLFEAYTGDDAAKRAGIRFEPENAPLGKRGTDIRMYAFTPLREGESTRAALERFAAWAVQLPLPPDRRIAFERVMRRDPDSGAWEDEGWRTFLLHRTSLLNSEHIVEAQARPDMNDPSRGEWLVAMELSAEGGRLFEEATARLVKRRFAITLDGLVESAPVVQTRIAGGRGVITMGAGAPEERARNARKLELVLRSGALPAPLTLESEDAIAPILPAGVFRALVTGASLVLALEVALALWLAFRKGRVRPSPKGTGVASP